MLTDTSNGSVPQLNVTGQVTTKFFTGSTRKCKEQHVLMKYLNVV